MKTANLKHGGSNTRLYSVWRGMLRRCEDENAPNYGHYGGRGIFVCEGWHDFSTFREWAYNNGYDENAPRSVCTIDRIDNNSGYSPENCKWSNAKQQGNNRRSNHYITIDGVTKTISGWSCVSGIKEKTISRRIICGVNEHDAVWKELKHG